jgi:hypothetical protein
MGENRGGPRQGSVGKQYPNRSDLSAPGKQITPSNVPKSSQYGQGAAQSRALKAAPTSGPPARMAPQQGGANPAALAPGSIPSLSDPSARPDEPVTAGLPLGAGPGTSAMGMVPMDSPELSILRALYLQYPSPDIRRQIAYLEETLQG